MCCLRFEPFPLRGDCALPGLVGFSCLQDILRMFDIEQC